MPVSTSSRTPAWEGGVDWDCWVSGRGWGPLCGSDGGDEFLQVNGGQLVGEVAPNVFFHWHTKTHRLSCPLNKKQTYNQSPPLTGFLLNSPMPPSRASFISLAAAIRSSSCSGRTGQRVWRVVCCYLPPKQQQCKGETSACCCAFQEHSVCTESDGSDPITPPPLCHAQIIIAPHLALRAVRRGGALASRLGISPALCCRRCRRLDGAGPGV